MAHALDNRRGDFPQRQQLPRDGRPLLLLVNAGARVVLFLRLVNPNIMQRGREPQRIKAALRKALLHAEKACPGINLHRMLDAADVRGIVKGHIL